ncbi:DUF4012 domain-containing protein [Cellulomonas sp. P5_C5]
MHPALPRHRRIARGDRGAARTAGLVCAAAGVTVLGLGGWLAVDAVQAADALQAAKGDVQQLQAEVTAGDRAAADASLVRLQSNAARAARATTGPAWSVAGVLPWVGVNSRAVQSVADAVDDLAQDALPALMEATSMVDPSALAPVDGRIDIAPLAAAAPAVVAADHAVRGATDQLDAIDTSTLLGVVAQPVELLRDQLADVASTTATAARAAQLVPAMLGADGPRDYLVLVQNNAEQRATGGMPGSVLHLRTDNGAVQVVDARAAGSLSGLAEPVLPLSEAEGAVYGPELGTDMRDVNFTPDFPRSGALAKGIWEAEVGGHIDGVLSVDPGALALMLSATGPVTLSDGSTLSGEDAVATLLNTVYLDKPDPADQDAYFADAAQAAFGALVSGQGSPTAVMDALAEAARQGRLLVWSADEGEQERLRGTVLSGELRGVDGDSPVIGVYLNDGTQAKLGYYLDLDVAAEATECRPDGSQVVHLSVSLTSTAPADAATLPAYLVGLDDLVPLGDIRTNVMIYAPFAGAFSGVRVNSETQGLFSQVHDGLALGARTFTLKPGESATLEMEITTGMRQPGSVHIRSTPTARQSGDAVVASACID